MTTPSARYPIGTIAPVQEGGKRLNSTRVRAAAAIEDYNHNRRHSACQMMSSVAYEQMLAAKEAA